MKRIILVTTVALVSVGLIVAALKYRSARHAHDLASTRSDQGKGLDAEIAKTRDYLATRIHKAEEMQVALQQAQHQKVPTAKTLAESKAPAQPRRDMADLMETNPSLRALFRQSFRANLGLQFQPFYDRAHLSPEQIEKFESLMTDAEQDKIDLRAAAKTQGLATNDPSLAKMRQQAYEKLQSAQKEILGDAGYQELQRYDRLQPLLGFTTSFGSLVAQTGNPLTASQCDLLLDVLSNASSQYQSGGRADLTTIDSKHVLQQAELILTPIQFAALQANANMIELTKLRAQFFQQKKAAAK
jgi:hypothetical protein